MAAQNPTTDYDVKHCKKCARDFPRTEQFFRKKKKYKDSLSYACRTCERKIEREKYRKTRGLTDRWQVVGLSDSLLPVKACTLCREVYSRDRQFFKIVSLKENRDGYRSSCNNCERLRSREHSNRNKTILKKKAAEYYKKNKDKIDRRNRQWSEDNREYLLKYQKSWRSDENNRERQSETRRAWREKNRVSEREQNKKRYDPVKAAENRKRQRENNPTKYKNMDRSKAANYRAKKLKLPNTMTSKDIEYMYQYWAYSCAVCGRQEGLFTLTIAADHWYSISDMENPIGTQPHNMIPLCHGIDGCNNSKSATDPHTWLLSRFGARRAKTIARRIEQYFTHVRERSAADAVGGTRCEEDVVVYGITAGEV